TSLTEALTQNQLAPAGNPRIEPQTIGEGQDLTYVATFEVFPEVALKPIGSLQIERVAATGDKVTVDFEGAIDGVAFAGGKGEGVAIVLGEGRMLAQLEQGLVGAVAGEQIEIGVDFPADYRATELAGKHAEFGVFVKGVEEPSLPELDEEFCKSFAVAEGGIPKLREEVAANMRRELDQALRNRNKAVVMDRLYRDNPIELPNALLESQIQSLQVEAMRRSGAKDASQAPPREPLVEPARRRAALGLLVNDIIRRESIVLDPKRSSARLDELVGSYGDAAALRRAYLQNAEAMRQVESLALEDQVVEWILEHARVTDRPSTFKEVMNFEG